MGCTMHKITTQRLVALTLLCRSRNGVTGVAKTYHALYVAVCYKSFSINNDELQQRFVCYIDG